MNGGRFASALSGPEAFAARDGWALLTIASYDQPFEAEAFATVAMLINELALRPPACVLDIGVGIGRHLRAFADRGFLVGGVEQSALLCNYANRAVGTEVVTHGEFEALPQVELPALYLLMSDTVSILGRAGQHSERLRQLRQQMADESTVVIEVSSPRMWPTSGVHVWPPIDDISISETVEIHHTVATRSVQFEYHGESFELVGDQLLLDLNQWRELLEGTGFRLTGEIHTHRGQRCSVSDADNIVMVATAAKGWNYLSDLSEFLAAWRDPAHVRNQLTTPLTSGSTGRITDLMNAPIGRGATLTRHHDSFRDALEVRIGPLVAELVFGWNQILYSSCEGHYFNDTGACPVITDAYIAAVAVDDRHLDLLQALLEVAAESVGSTNVIDPLVRERKLWGPGGAVQAVDLVMRRQDGASWESYCDAVDWAVAVMVENLQGRRAGVRS